MLYVNSETSYLLTLMENSLLLELGNPGNPYGPVNENISIYKENKWYYFSLACLAIAGHQQAIYDMAWDIHLNLCPEDIKLFYELSMIG